MAAEVLAAEVLAHPSPLCCAVRTIRRPLRHDTTDDHTSLAQLLQGPQDVILGPLVGMNGWLDW